MEHLLFSKKFYFTFSLCIPKRIKLSNINDVIKKKMATNSVTDLPHRSMNSVHLIDF